MRQYGYEILKGDMLPLETKQNRGKILPNKISGGGVLGQASHNRKSKRDILLGTWNVRSL